MLLNLKLNTMKSFLFLMAAMTCLWAVSCKSDQSSKDTVYNLKLGTLSNSLCGTFTISSSPDSSSALYDTFTFSSNGQGQVSAYGITGAFDFLQVFDTLFLFPDRDVFVFKIGEQGELIGVSNWIDQTKYIRLQDDTVSCIPTAVDSLYLYRYYEFILATVKENKIITNTGTTSSLEKLCANNFSKACLAMANIGMRKALGNSLFNDEKQNADEKVLAYLQKAIDMGDTKGHGKMGEYYLLLYDEDKAKECYAKGCDMGDKNACLKMMENGW